MPTREVACATPFPMPSSSTWRHTKSYQEAYDRSSRTNEQIHSCSIYSIAVRRRLDHAEGSDAGIRAPLVLAAMPRLNSARPLFRHTGFANCGALACTTFREQRPRFRMHWSDRQRGIGLVVLGVGSTGEPAAPACCLGSACLFDLGPKCVPNLQTQCVRALLYSLSLRLVRCKCKCPY